MNIIEMFPKRKRVVGWNTDTGKRTAHSLHKEKRWQEMMSDILGCETMHELTKCAFYWSAQVEEWPTEWVILAQKEFDEAFKAIEAWSAQQAE